jgi:hypothetical protein
MKNFGRAFIAALLLAPPAFSMELPPGAGKMSLREGDIIFIHSGSSQAPAIEEVMGSSWTHVGVAVRKGASWFVAEAAGTVSLTPLSKFLGRSRDRGFMVKRFKEWGARPVKKDLLSLKKRLSAELWKKYDIYFEWSDASLYCSEYVWKAYYNAVTGHPALSRPQKFSDLKLDGPLARELINKRYTAAGKKLNMDERIVTPAALLNSSLLQTVALALE